MIEKLDSTLFSDNYKIFGVIDFDFFTIFSEDLDPNSVILDDINFDDEGFNYCDTFIMRLLSC